MAGTQNDSQRGQGKAVEADGFSYRKGLGEGYAKGCLLPRGRDVDQGCRGVRPPGVMFTDLTRQRLQFSGVRRGETAEPPLSIKQNSTIMHIPELLAWPWAAGLAL